MISGNKHQSATAWDEQTSGVRGFLAVGAGRWGKAQGNVCKWGFYRGK
jgi:hypothetical protein